MGSPKQIRIVEKSPHNWGVPRIRGPLKGDIGAIYRTYWDNGENMETTI